MRKNQWWILLSLTSALLLAGCDTETTASSYGKGDEITFYDFNTGGSWEEGYYQTASLRVDEGVYRIQIADGTNTLWWGQWGDTYEDIVIDVDVSQVTDVNQNAYGVMCRARGAVGQTQPIDPELAVIMAQVTAEATVESTSEIVSTLEVTAEMTAESTLQVTDEATPAPEITLEATGDDGENVSQGDGYLFLIQGTGAFSIQRSRGRAVTALVDWRTSDAIVVGPSQNHLRVICADHYLAFYVNDRLLAEVEDDLYDRGQVGLVASSASRLGVRVEFDNLQISEVTRDN